MEWLLIVGIALIILVLCYFLSKKTKTNVVSEEPKEPVIEPSFIPNENGTVIDLKGLEKYGYGDLASTAPLVSPYYFFFFIIRYKARNGNPRFSIGVSRGFEEPRIVKNCTYDDYEDLTKERIEKFVDKFDIFVDDKRFNELVCKYRKDSIIEIIKKL